MLFILFLGHINTRKLHFIVPERISSDSVTHQIEPSYTRWGTIETHFELINFRPELFPKLQMVQFTPSYYNL